MAEKIKIRPFARLLTMLGEQLIKNEKIALVELIKNAYDADASWVQIRFINFKGKEGEDSLEFGSNSYIEIEDNGDGMTSTVIKQHWMNPATPIKLLKKKIKEKTNRKNRIIQGEKGIGRFAVFKLGSTVEISTRSIEDEKHEVYIKSDFSGYDSEFTQEKGEEKDIYLDQIEIDYTTRTRPIDIVEGKIKIRNEKKERPPYGTLIKISNLKGDWTMEKINSVFDDVLKLEFPFKEKGKEDFVVDICVKGKSLFESDEVQNKLTALLSTAPLRVKDGYFNDEEKSVTMTVNGSKVVLDLERLKAIKEFKKRFCNKDGEFIREPECGPFTFDFYVFDLTSKAPPKHLLDSKTEVPIVKDHRIYLYRDDVRVYPYGDPDDDWLGIDVLRGTGRAGDYLSNDQTVGYIGITQKNNRKLKDKTNREGLIEIGGALEDFKRIIQGILGYLRKEYQKYKDANDKINASKIFKEQEVEKQLKKLEEYLKEKKDKEGADAIRIISANYSKERDYLSERAEVTEELAAVGLAVEATSHDVMVMISRAKEAVDSLVKMNEAKEINVTDFNNHLLTLRGQISFIEDQLKGIQPIFRSSKRSSRDYRVKKIIEDVKKYYSTVIARRNIKVTIEEHGTPLVVKCTEAVLLQTFINLFDNACYWLDTQDSNGKEIRIVLDGSSYSVIFADNGPGIWDDDVPYIFNAFFSAKGLKGRGLGLYIARQLLERHEFEISYITERKRKILSGANLYISFIPKEEN